MSRRFIRHFRSLGQTHGFIITMKCGHIIQRNTTLAEDQSQAAYLSRMIVQKLIDRQKGLPEIDFDIVCPECQGITKFTEIEDMTLTWDNNLVDD